ncbi:MAG: alpha-1,4-glucan--maltose-1-phosphate maltosyltransferase [Phycisphaeraceae bacterium]|nr:alpha-1,4-glucan--maltose-1-phosphate maltosyltransferase [Phycisphaeraceae bacterium]
MTQKTPAPRRSPGGTKQKATEQMAEPKPPKTQPAGRAGGALPPGDADGRARVFVENVQPDIDAGRFAAKGVEGDAFVVEADVFADGHDLVGAVLLHRREGESVWSETRMEPVGNDRFHASFTPDRLGFFEYTVVGFVDRYGSWARDLRKRAEARQDVAIELLIGADHLERAARGLKGAAPVAKTLSGLAKELREKRATEKQGAQVDAATSVEIIELMRLHAERAHAVEYPRVLRMFADRERAAFSAWYEFFPRSCAATPGEHGTFADAERWLPRIAKLGFDVVYLPPIHPIGRVHRKGRNNTLTPEAHDVGSPWAIGSTEGGHEAILPELGTPEDFRKFVATARSLGIDVALDIAFQCAPDHPWVKEHPQWFRALPDGTIRYAENPPKKYQDIYPFDFETDDWRNLWAALRDVVAHWIEQGVTVFRVDNPHTKSFRFWEWLIADIRRTNPEMLFLSEAFTRPKVMYALAKLGFTQSYTYFAWKNRKWELEQYLREVTSPPVSRFFRPNPWPNTPDILNEFLQHGGRPACVARLVLAATLCGNYGVYGPPYELAQVTPREPGSEEYLDSEKYQLRHWALGGDDTLAPVMERVNRIRRENPALRRDDTLRFHHCENDQIICYSKRSHDGENAVVVVVNLDPHHTQSGFVNLDLPSLGLAWDDRFQAHDALNDARYLWAGPRNYVELHPHSSPAHVFVIRKSARTEQDFEYFV